MLWKTTLCPLSRLSISGASFVVMENYLGREEPLQASLNFKFLRPSEFIGLNNRFLTVLWKTTLCPLPRLSMWVARLRQMARCRMASMVWASKKSCGRAAGKGETGVRDGVRLWGTLKNKPQIVKIDGRSPTPASISSISTIEVHFDSLFFKYDGVRYGVRNLGDVRPV